MDLSSLNNTLNILIKKVDGYLDSVPEIDFADYQQQMDTVYISNQYNRIVYEYSNLLRLIINIPCGNNIIMTKAFLIIMTMAFLEI